MPRTLAHSHAVSIFGMFLLVTLYLAGLSSAGVAGDIQIDADATWTGERTLDGKVLVAKGTLTIEPGSKITFKSGSEINLRAGAALTAKGTEAKPIEFVGGEKAGIILSDGGTIILERCR